MTSIAELPHTSGTDRGNRSGDSIGSKEILQTTVVMGSRGIPARYGGYEQHTQDLVESLAPRGFRFYAVCESSLQEFPYEYPNVGRVFFPVAGQFRFISEFIFDAVAVTWASLSGADTIYILTYVLGPFIVIPKLFRARTIVNVDGIEWSRRKFPWAVKVVLKVWEGLVSRNADHIVCDSKAIQEHHLRAYGTKSSTYIPYFVRLPEKMVDCTEVLDRLGLRPREYYLVVARLEPENNIDLIVREFSRSITNRKLLVIGTTSNSKYVRYLNSVRTNKVVFSGPIYDKPLLYSIRRNAYAYIHGHEAGGTNPTLLEAMASGNPVLSYDAPSNREVLGDAGLFFSRGDGDLAESISILENGKSLYEEMSKSSLRIIRESYSPEVVLPKFEALFLSKSESPG